MDKRFEEFLQKIAYNIRVSSILMTTQAGSGHPTSCLSAADIMAVVYFYGMHFDPNNLQNPNNDRFILSKGHASPILYAVWKELGFLTEQDLLTYRLFDSPLEGHPTPRFFGAEVATGSLGQGLSIGAGMAKAAKMDKRDYITFVLMGDSEVAEGSVWEAAEVSAYYKLNNLIGIIDANRLGQSTEVIEDHHMAAFADKFEAFGWQPFIADGHNIRSLIEVFKKARDEKEKPSIIIAKTYKGYGIEMVEDKQGFHGKPFKPEQLDEVFKELHNRFKNIADKKITYDWQPTLPPVAEPIKPQKITLPQSNYKKGEEIKTRQAYGYALRDLGGIAQNVVSLDAEVKNSTYAEYFAEKYPERFVQCFIAEQNMVGMAVGMATRGKIPFVSTFAAFFSRAFDQIRMAAIGRSPLRLVGSHVGVSIGQDGPSQMGLEDIAMMRTLPNSVVLYPADAVCTQKLVELMANRNDGISYMRTTRPSTPVIYDNDEEFVLGGCKILRESDDDKACVVGAGVTLFEALKAYERLQKEDISVSVIDLYSIKPLDVDTLRSMTKKGYSHIITVEDHYIQGGLGQAVTSALCNDDVQITNLAVNKLPRSGSPEKLMEFEGIDAEAIYQEVMKLLIS